MASEKNYSEINNVATSSTVRHAVNVVVRVILNQPLYGMKVPKQSGLVQMVHYYSGL